MTDYNSVFDINIRKGQAPRYKAKARRHQCWVLPRRLVVISDLETQLAVPREVAITSLRPDIVLWSVLCELTCPWEENAKCTHEMKLAKYKGLINEIASNGWSVKVLALKVVCREFASISLRSYFTAIEGSNRKIKGAVLNNAEKLHIELRLISAYQGMEDGRSEMFKIVVL